VHGPDSNIDRVLGVIVVDITGIRRQIIVDGFLDKMKILTFLQFVI